MQAHLLAAQLEAARAAIALKVHTLAAQGHVTACQVQAPDAPKLAAPALAIAVQTAYNEKLQHLCARKQLPENSWGRSVPALIAVYQKVRLVSII